jgi:hypothetical protein
MYASYWTRDFSENSIKIVRMSYYTQLPPIKALSKEDFNSMIDFFINLMKTYGCHSVKKLDYIWNPRISYDVEEHSITFQYKDKHVVVIELCNSKRVEKINIPYVYSLLNKFRFTYTNKVD